MKTLKRLALRAILSKEQRAVIIKSVAYSEHKYRVHGDVEGAIRVGIIRKELEQVISVPEPKFTKTQVDRIVKVVLCGSVDWLRKCISVGTVVKRKKCDKCEHRDECEVRKALFNDADDKGNGTEREDTANAHENDATEHPLCGNAECYKICPSLIDECPNYIRPTDDGDQTGAPEDDADNETEREAIVEMQKEGE